MSAFNIHPHSPARRRTLAAAMAMAASLGLAGTAMAQAYPAKAITFVVPVFASFYGVLFLQETVTAWMLACGLVIAAVLALVGVVILELG